MFISLTPPNCTLVELKYVNADTAKKEVETPNCTLVELKYLLQTGILDSPPPSKLYLSGIEISSLVSDEDLWSLSKLYLSAIEIDQKRFTSLLSSTPNCTLV